MNLTTKQKAYLRGLGQSLRPQLHLGHEGLTPATLSALEDLFRKRELVKVRILNTAEEEPAAAAREMAERAGAGLVGVVGRTFVLYRPNPELKERIALPAADAPDPAGRARRGATSPPGRPGRGG